MSFWKIGIKRAVFTFVTISLALLPLHIASAAGTEAAKPLVPAMADAPEFQLPDLNGGTVDLATVKGKKPVLIYFWASWCPYCMAVRPKVTDLRNAVPKDQLEIIGINVGGGDSLEKVKRFQQAHPTPYIVAYDAEGKVTRQYQVQGIPLFILLDKTGAVKYRGNELPADLMNRLKS